MQQMIKRIKFFIRIGGTPCRTLSDLQSNFYLQDVMTLHREGVLSRWLRVNDHQDLAEKVEGMPEGMENSELAEKLVGILCPNFPEGSVADALHYFYLEDERQKRVELAQRGDEKWRECITLYHEGYVRLLLDIEAHKEDFGYLCRSAVSLVDNFWGLVELNRFYFQKYMIENAPCIFFPLLAMGRFLTGREDDVQIRESLAQHVASSFSNSRKGDDPGWYRSLCASQNIETIADHNFYVVKKTVDSWDDIVQDDDCRIMVIHMGSTTACVRSTRTRDEFNRSDIEKMFPIFAGLDYKDPGSSPLVAYIDIPDVIKARCTVTAQGSSSPQDDTTTAVPDEQEDFAGHLQDSPFMNSLKAAQKNKPSFLGSILRSI